ncbi:CPBP family intramembrane glutamic endopeptidase [Mucilaginibacter sp. X4EP1]|uniref:CPBP family intramembrane glutamic endopeptidase n=1 Tax=Mucilaginibacter sp. X4EP1 TaxID=2723092 RepID=UPI0021679F3D|nr:CPBP family intramembrane glutamic endopeptidase [Mucilaginibacter sp. X4EP1]MCS3812453.1 hypothetical protein [Mucilaginibacter sp. X4EP1]
MIPDLTEAQQPIDLNETVADSQFAYPNVKALFRLFFVFLFYMVVCGIFEGILLMGIRDIRSPLLRSFLNLSTYVVTFLAVTRYAIKKCKKQEGEDFNISFNKTATWVFPVLTICALALVVILERLSNIIPMPVAVQHYFERMFQKDFISIITMVIAAPILEEILFRGIVLRGLLKNYSPHKAIIISGVFFGLMHLNPWQALPAIFGGIFIGWIYYKTQSVIPGMIVHATVNLSAALFLFLPKKQQSFLSLLGMPCYILLCIVSLLIFSTGCILIQKRFADSNDERIPQSLSSEEHQL